MKIGRERTPLTERLNEKASNQADQAADLMASHLKRFESDCTTSLNAVRTTIENDMVVIEAKSAMLKRAVRPVWISMGVASLTMIAISFALSWTFASRMIDKAQSASLWQMGLTINQTTIGTVLSWDEKRVRLIECRIGGASAKCLQFLEKE